MSAIHSVFRLPPLGKPDPTQPKPLEGPDTRRRVIQRGSKESTFWHATFNLIRERYNAPNTTNLNERKFEKIVSSRRKAMSIHEESLPLFVDQLNDRYVKEALSLVTKVVALQRSGSELFKNEAIIAEAAERKKMGDLLPQFLAQNQCGNLYDYLVHLKAEGRKKIELKFLSDLGVTPKDLLPFVIRLDPNHYHRFLQDKNWESLPLGKQTALLQTIAMTTAARGYGLKLSSWHPSQPIESLITELVAHGPLSLQGRFGPLHYKKDPKKLDKTVENRTVYGWSKDHYKAAPFAYRIVLIGAEKTPSRDYVYYIDPKDDSDPEHPEEQKIYIMTYPSLTSADRICDTHGVLRDHAPSTIGYAYYRAKEPPAKK